MLVATGQVGSSGGASNTVEYIDLSSTSTTCIGTGSNTLPVYLYGAVGGVGTGGMPKICGGWSGPNWYRAAVTNACNVLNTNSNVWSGTTALPNSVGFAAASTSPYPSASIFVTGGGSGSIQVISTSSQSLANLVWTSAPSLPLPLWKHCQVQLNTTAVLVIGGGTTIFNRYFSTTYILNTVTNKWTAGPQLAIGRLQHSCARILTDGTPNKYSTIVVGGIIGINNQVTASVEILDDGATAWRAGPSFPMSMNLNFLG